MGHLFVVTGPPGSGKTSLIKKVIEDRKWPIRPIQRITTRPRRPEEDDPPPTLEAPSQNFEYTFLPEERFVGRLTKRSIVNLVQWGDNLYATDLDDIRTHLMKCDCILLEDMPSAIHLKMLPEMRATVILLFTGSRDELCKLEFVQLQAEAGQSEPCITEWLRRLDLKFDAQRLPVNQTRAEYRRDKLARALPDLAFMAGCLIRGKPEIRVLANPRNLKGDSIADSTVLAFEKILAGKRRGQAIVLLPFKGEFELIYEKIIRPTVEGNGFDCCNGRDLSKDPVVVDDVVKHIGRADLVIVDITGGNENVLYELGAASVLCDPKNIVLITQDKGAPFLVNHRRRIEYANTPQGWETLELELAFEIASGGRK